MSLVGKGVLGERVHLPVKDEIGEMGSAFNDMSVKPGDSRDALFRAEEKYRSIFEDAIEGIFQCTPGQGRFITANPLHGGAAGIRFERSPTSRPFPKTYGSWEISTASMPQRSIDH